MEVMQMPCKKTSLKKIFSVLLIGLMMVTFLSACSDEPSESSSSQVESAPESSSPPEPGGSREPGSVNYDDMMAKLAEVQKVNDKAAAWLTIPNTNMDMPIIYDPDNDNDYWVDKTLEGETVNPIQGNGVFLETVTYLHSRVVLNADLENSSENFTIFGHNWDNIYEPLVIGNDPKYEMFAQLPSYTDYDFLKENPYVYFSTPDQEMVWVVFSVMYTEEYWTLSGLEVEYFEPNPTPAQKNVMISEMLQRSEYVMGVDVNADDKLLCLSTCTRVYDGVGAVQRYVVVARLLREGESDKTPISVSDNIDPKKPNF